MMETLQIYKAKLRYYYKAKLRYYKEAKRIARGESNT